MADPKVNLAGYNIKEVSLIILMVSLGAVFVMFGVAVAFALLNNPTITISGDIDVGQFVGVIIGISMVAVVLVSQQLTSKSQAAAVAATDSVWLAEKETA